MKKPKAIQLTIPQPCHEDWNQMTPQEQGRFCDACQKCVVDFTQFTDQELYNYINTHIGEKTCGRFQASQLNRSIQLPPQPHSKLYRLAVAMGLAIVVVTATEIKSFAKAPYIEYRLFDSPQDDSTTSNSDTTIIKGKVVDDKKEPMINVAIQLIDSNSNVIAGAVTDYDGNYFIKIKSQEGKVELRCSYVAHKTVVIQNIPTNKSGKTINITMEPSGTLGLMDITYTGYIVPLIDRDNPSPMNKTISGDEIDKMAY